MGIHPTRRRLQSARTSLLFLALSPLSASAANLEQAINLPNLVFSGKAAAQNFEPVQLSPLHFTGKQPAAIPAVTLPTLTFIGSGDPKGISTVNMPPLTFKGKLPQ